MTRRHAIYFTPTPGTPLARRGAAWLGWDVATGTAVDRPSCPGVALESATLRPHPYGFHATIKPPFRLARGADTDQLLAALREECAHMPALEEISLEYSQIGTFLALVPSEPAPAIAALSSNIVQRLDRFRAPLSAGEFARRRPDRLTPRQLDTLRRWGYPYLFEDFRFHMTLSGPLDARDLERVTACARRHFGRCAEQLDVDALTLAVSDDRGRFRTVARVPLTGEVRTPSRRSRRQMP